MASTDAFDRYVNAAIGSYGIKLLLAGIDLPGTL